MKLTEPIRYDPPDGDHYGMKKFEGGDFVHHADYAALQSKLAAVLTDPTYKGGVQFWIKRHDELSNLLAEALSKLAAVEAEVATVYDHITDGRFTKANTLAARVIDATEESYAKAFKHRKEWLQSSQSREAGLRKALKAAVLIADGLAAQQAMGDDWYVGELERLRTLACNVHRA